MTWVPFFLVLIIVSANFTDWLLADTGSARISEKMLRFYVAVDGNWRSLYQMPVSFVCKFMDRLFSRNLALFVLNVFIYTCISVAIISIPYFAYWFLMPASVGIVDIVAAYLVHVLANFPADLVCWCSLRFLFSGIARAGPARAFGLLILSILTALLCLYMPLAITGRVMDFAFGIPHPTIAEVSANPTLDKTMLMDIRNALLSGTIANSDESGAGQLLFWSISFIVAIPLIVVATVTLGALMINVFRPLLRSPIMLIMERIELSGKHAFTIVAIVLSVPITLLAAVPKH